MWTIAACQYRNEHWMLWSICCQRCLCVLVSAVEMGGSAAHIPRLACQKIVTQHNHAIGPLPAISIQKNGFAQHITCDYDQKSKHGARQESQSHEQATFDPAFTIKTFFHGDVCTDSPGGNHGASLVFFIHMNWTAILQSLTLPVEVEQASGLGQGMTSNASSPMANRQPCSTTASPVQIGLYNGQNISFRMLVISPVVKSIY